MKRRNLIGSLLGVPLLDLPAWAEDAKLPPLPPSALADSDPEKYWRRIREEQFILPQARAFLNTGTLGIAPKPVLQATISYLLQSADLTVNELPRWGGEPLDDLRTDLARFAGCGKDELTLTHNTTEGMGAGCLVDDYCRHNYG